MRPSPTPSDDLTEVILSTLEAPTFTASGGHPQVGVRRRVLAEWIQEIQGRLRPAPAMVRDDDLTLSDWAPVGVDEVPIGTPPLRPRPRRSALTTGKTTQLPFSELLTEDIFTEPGAAEPTERKSWFGALKARFCRPKRAPYLADLSDLTLTDEVRTAEPTTEEEDSSSHSFFQAQGSGQAELDEEMPEDELNEETLSPVAPLPVPLLRRPVTGPLRDLNTVNTFAVDAAHNGFTVEEAFALFMEKRVLQGYRVRARIAPPRPPGDYTPAHWNEQWNQAWAEMETWQTRLAAVRSVADWQAYLDEAPRTSAMYQRWVPMGWKEGWPECMPDPNPLVARSLPWTDGAPSWAALVWFIQVDQEPYFVPYSTPLPAMPARWTSAVADRLLARWMRRVGLQVLQWPWSVGESASLKWTVFVHLRRLQQGLVAQTGWRGPVLGLGGPMWWRMGAAVARAGGGGGAAYYNLGIPTMDTGGEDWMGSFYHEWFHLLERLLTESAPSRARRNRHEHLKLANMESLLSKQDPTCQAAGGALRRARRAVHTLVTELKQAASDQAPADWCEVRAYFTNIDRWAWEEHDRLNQAEYRFWSNPQNWPTLNSFQRLGRNMPTLDARHQRHVAYEAQMAYRRELALAEEAPGWYARMAGSLATRRAWGHKPKAGWQEDWWERPCEHLAMAFEEAVFVRQGQMRLLRSEETTSIVLSLTPMECAAMAPAWGRFFRTLDPVWRRIVRLRYTAWQHHPFPMDPH